MTPFESSGTPSPPPQSVTSRLETSRYRDFSHFFEGTSIVLEKIGLSKKYKNIQFEVFQESCPSSKIVCQGSFAEASTSVFLQVCLLIHAFDVNTYHY